jgi:hypothetical protein
MPGEIADDTCTCVRWVCVCVLGGGLIMVVVSVLPMWPHHAWARRALDVAEQQRANSGLRRGNVQKAGHFYFLLMPGGTGHGNEAGGPWCGKSSG